MAASHKLALVLVVVASSLQCTGADGAGGPPPPIPPVHRLTFARVPVRWIAGRPLDSIIVQAVDAQGAIVVAASAPVTLGIRATSGTAPALNGTLTVNLAGGTATFTGISVGAASAALAFVASAAGFEGGTSPTFQVDAAPVAIDSTSMALAGDSAGRAAGLYVFNAPANVPLADSGTVLIGAERGGFLRRVVRGTRSGSTISYETVRANLDEVILNDSIALRLEAQPALTQFVAAASGVVASAGSFTLTNTVLTGTASEGVVISNATLQVTPVIDLKAVWGAFTLKSVHLAINGAVQFAHTVQVVGIRAPRAESGSLLLGTIIMPFTIRVGSIPLPGHVTIPITLEWTLSAAGPGAMQLGWTSSAAASVGTDWSSTGGFVPIRTASYDFSPRFASPSVQANVTTSLGLRATPELRIANVSAGTLRVEPSGAGTAAADLASNRWTTSCRSKVNMGLDLDLRIFGQATGTLRTEGDLVESASPACDGTGPLTSPAIALSTSTASLAGLTGGASQSATILISNAGTGSLSGLSLGNIVYGAGQPAGWLTAALNGATAPATLTLTAAPGALAPGSYSATLPVQSSANAVTNSPRTVSVTFTVSAAPAPSIALSSSSLTFAATAGGSSPAAQSVAVSNSGTGTLSGIAADAPAYPSGQPGGWLATSLDRTTAPATLTFTATTGALGAGTYRATVAVRSTASGITNSPQTVSVAFTVASPPAPAPAPSISLSPTTIAFSATAGGPSPAAQNVAITNSGTGTLSNLSVDEPVYEAGQPTGWLTSGLGGTTAPATLTFTAVTGTLPAGTYAAAVRVASTVSGVTNSPQTVRVTFDVAAPPPPPPPPPAPTIVLSPSSLAFDATSGGSNPAPQDVTITNSGTGSLSGLSADPPAYGAGQPTGWLAATLSGSTAPATLSVTASVGALAAGSYTATVSVKSAATGVTNSPRAVAVTFTVVSPAPPPGADVVLKGFAFVPPSITVAPGTTITFTNNDGVQHNVTFADAAVTSIGNFTAGSRTTVMPAAAGTYAYRCTLHGGMTGSVKVQ